jgi:hypothetical protein
VGHHKPVEAKEQGPDFEWSYTEEPHRTRRALVLQAHPEVSARRSNRSFVF